jgi:hypothetical protein
MRLLARFSACLATLIAVVAAIWATGAIYFDLPAPPVIRNGAAAVWLLGFIIAWFWLPHRRWSRLIVGLVFLCILGWWLSIPPRQDRDWKPDVAVLPNAVIEGDQVTISTHCPFDCVIRLRRPRADLLQYRNAPGARQILFRYWRLIQAV